GNPSESYICDPGTSNSNRSSIQKGNKFVNFTNQNTDLKSAPILVWIEQGNAHSDDSQVYDAALFYRSPARAGLITIMNTEPFTLTTDTRGVSGDLSSISEHIVNQKHHSH
ncbi:hypothetical protein PMAYCL1PPCAC_21608, partial [Pristionchus mayeri]